MTSEAVTPHQPKYFKVEEHRVQTHEEAQALADSLFQTFTTSVTLRGDRTTEKAKVRIRRRHSLGDFRVILYRAISGASESPSDQEESTTSEVNEEVSSDDAHTQKQSKIQRKKEVKEAARRKGKKHSGDRKTNYS